MKHIKKRNVVILLVLLVTTLNLSFFFVPSDSQETPTVTLKRYSTQQSWINGTNQLLTSISPQHVKHYNSNLFTDLVYEDHYATDGYYLIQTSMISVQVFDWYTVFYDPDHDIVCVDDERWLVEVYGKNKKWREVDLYDVVLSSSFNDTHVTITRSLSGSEGQLNVSYVLSASNSLKHDVVFQSMFEDQETFMVVYKLTGVHGNVFSCKEETFVINQTTNLKTNRFTIGNGTRNILTENLDKIINETNTIEIDTHSSGSKIDIYIGNYTLNTTNTIYIDPDSDTWEISASSDDAYLSDLSGWETSATFVSCAQAGGYYLYAGQRYLDVGDSISQSASITTAYLQVNVYDVTRDDIDSNFYGEDVAQPETYGSGTTDIDARTRTSATVLWDEDSIGTGWKDTPELKTIIQELVNRGDWGSGDDIGILMIPTSASKNLRYYSYDQAGDNDPKLYIEWVAAGEEYERTASQGLTVALATTRILSAIRTATQSIGIALSTSRLIQIALSVTLAIGLALATTGNITVFKTVSQSITLALATTRLASMLRNVAQSITLALATSRGIEVTRNVAQSITVSLSGSRLIQVIKNVTLAIGIGLSTITVFVYGRTAALTLTIALATSRGLEMIKQVTQSITVALATSRLQQLIKSVTQAINVALSATGEIVEVLYNRTASLAIGIGLSTSHLIQIIIAATLALTVALTGVGYKIGEYAVSVSLSLSYSLISSVVTTFSEFVRMGTLLGGIFLFLLVFIPIYIIIRKA